MISLAMGSRAVAACLLVGAASAQVFAERNRSAFDRPLQGWVRACADFDMDGLVDFAVVGPDLSIRRNLGGGVFVPLATVPINVPTVRHVAAVDFDGDGDVDLMIDGRAHRNDGSGGFTPAPGATPALGGAIVGQHLFFDRDGDGDLDVLLLTNGLRLFDNDGTGGWTEVTIAAFGAAPGLMSEIALLDVDGDGDEDIVAAPLFQQPVDPLVFVNQGNGRFARQVVLPPLSSVLGASSLLGVDLAVGDFTGDGNEDLMLFVDTLSGSTTVVFARGAAGWTVRDLGGHVAFSEFCAVTDWDGDGRAELAMSTGLVRLVGATAFEVEPWPRPFPGQNPAVPMVVVDVDGDGIDDVVGPDGVIFRRPGGALVSSEATRANGTGALTGLFGVRRSGAGGRPQVLYRAGSTLMFASDAPLTSTDPFRVLRGEIALDPHVPVHDACFHELPNGELRAIAGPDITNFRVVGDTIEQLAGSTPSIVTLAIEAGELDGLAGDEIVASDGLGLGPRVFTWQGASFVEVSPTLPTAAASTVPAFDDVALADVDGDGDLDIVHELRVVENLGGAWAVGLSFAPLVPPLAPFLQPLDFDRDGDDDLFVPDGSGACRLFESTPGGFVDVTASRLPAGIAGWFAVARGVVGDVDGDGDSDVVLADAQQASSLLLRNDGGTFVAVAAPEAHGALVDVDGDGCADLFDGKRLWSSQHTFLSARHAVLVGGVLHLRLRSWRATGAVGFAWAIVGSAEVHLPIGGLGDLRVAPASAAVAPMAARGGGEFELVVGVPANPALLGAPLLAQGLALDAHGFELGNLVRERVQ